MSRGNRAGPPIGDEQWEAIGRLDCESQRAGIRKDNVRLST